MRASSVCLIPLLVLALPQVAAACPVCYGAPDSTMAKGMNNAIVFLLTIVGLVQIGFVALFWSFWRRAKELRKKRDQFRLITGGTY